MIKKLFLLFKKKKAESVSPYADPHTKPQMVKVKVKVKCTLVQALWLCTGRTVHRGSRGIALLYRHGGSVQGVRLRGGVGG
jgi:hypothetical protein